MATITAEEVSAMGIDDLVSMFRESVGSSVAGEVAGYQSVTKNRKEDVNLLEQEIRNRLHAGKRAQDTLQEYQDRS